MNFKKSALAGLIGLGLASSATAFDADSWEVSGFVKNETAVLQQDGTFNGQATGPTDTTVYNNQGDAIKSETTLKLFVNGELGENADVHAELNFVKDTQAEDAHFKTSEAYTQNDALRELYVDSLFGTDQDIEVRLGKQQVVWGTADGMKLLDIINPTDYREMAQNTMEDSRIPVWMLNANAPVGQAGNIQFILSQPRENVFAGMNRDIATGVRSTSSNITHDKGNPFILKGVDSITGERNGFLNGVPDIGSVASLFDAAFTSSTTGEMLATYTSVTVNAFASQYSAAAIKGMATAYSDNGYGLNMYTMANSGYDGAQILGAFASNYDTNLINAANSGVWNLSGTSGTDSIFEYMADTTFATFDTFSGAKSEYVFDMPDDYDLNFATRYKNSLDNGLNYSVAYAYAYGKNPVITLDWYNTSGTKLYTQYATDGSNTLTLNTAADGSGSTHDSQAGANAPILRFTQTLEREHNLGTAFDYTLDSEALGGVVLRGEFLYTKDQRDPVVDRGKLSVGDLAGALKMEKADHLKYVIGADITVLTNMLVSGQFIQDRNLDYVDQTSAYGTNLGKYTADFASMHMSNGFKKAEENKEFYSLFLSKPFGPNQLGRWNNILMLEEGGGRWNRFDVEYSFTDQLIGTFELNNYWGDKNTQFGQLEDASNLQLGVKYLF